MAPASSEGFSGLSSSSDVEFTRVNDMKKILAAGMACAFFLLGATGCGGENVAGYQKIAPAEAKSMMDKGGVTIVDVRREDEYAAGHIPHAILVTNETIGDKMPAALPDKEAVLLVYCRSGARSNQASNKLLKIGYKKVYDMGGIQDWPYEVEK